MSENIMPALDQAQAALEAGSWKIYTEQLNELNADRALADAFHPQDPETAALWEAAQTVEDATLPETDLDAEEQAERIIAEAGLIAFMTNKDPSSRIRPIEITEDDKDILYTFARHNPDPETAPDVLSVFDIATKPKAIEHMSASLQEALRDNPYMPRRSDPNDPNNPLQNE